MKIFKDGNFTDWFSALVTTVSATGLLVMAVFFVDVYSWKFWILLGIIAIPGAIVSAAAFVKNIGIKPFAKDPVGLRKTQKYIDENEEA